MKRLILLAATAALLAGNTALAGVRTYSRVTRVQTRTYRPARVTVRTTRVVRTAAVTKGYHLTHATRFVGGYYYAGGHHNHWARAVYSRVYGRTVYLDPGLRVWYFWDPSRGGYYPVSCIR